MRKLSTYAMGLYAVLFIGSIVTILLKSIIAKESLGFGREALGIYTYFLSLNAVFALVFSFGLPDLLTKVTIDKTDYSKDFHRFGIGIMNVLTVAGIILTVLLWNVVDQVHLMAILIIGPTAMMPVSTAVLRGDLETRSEVTYRLLRRTSPLLFLILVITVGVWAGITSPNNMTPVYITVVSWYLGTAYIWRLLYKRGLIVGPAKLWEIVKQPWLRSRLVLSGSIWGAAIMGIIGGQGDRLIVGQSLGFAELGGYSGALLYYGLLGQILEVWGRLYITLFPREDNRTIEKYKRILSLTAVLLPMTGFMTLVAVPVTSWLVLDNTYTDVIPLYAILSFAFVYKATELVNLAMAITIEKPQINMKSTTTAVILYMPVLYVLVTNWGVFGAAASQVIFWGIYSSVQTLLFKEYLPEHARFSAKINIGTILIYALTMVAYFAVDNLIWRVLVPPALYIGLGHLFGLWNIRYLWKVGSELGGEFYRKLRKRSAPSTEGAQ